MPWNWVEVGRTLSPQRALNKKNKLGRMKGNSTGRRKQRWQMRLKQRERKKGMKWRWRDVNKTGLRGSSRGSCNFKILFLLLSFYSPTITLFETTGHLQYTLTVWGYCLFMKKKKRKIIQTMYWLKLFLYFKCYQMCIFSQKRTFYHKPVPLNFKLVTKRGFCFSFILLWSIFGSYSFPQKMLLHCPKW